MITKQVTMPTATAGVHLGGSRMFFAGVEPSSAVRPWVTDGTAAGSQQLNSVGMTVTASFNYSMQRIGNGSLVAFHGWDANGAELWLTDGTVAGTKMAFDFSPGWRSGLPLFSFGRAGESYVMIADDNVVGYGRGEPYALPLSYFGAAFNEVYGEACNGTQGKPRLRGLGGAPTLGNANFALEISNGRPNAVTALLLSPSPASIPLPPCTLLVSLAGAQIETRLLDNNGRVVIPISVPNAVGLVGLDVYWQGVIIDPQGSFANNFAFTNGLRTMVGL
jgi:ELWxxDGT repeat protein